MNYIRQINAFWEMQAFKPISAGETRLYFAILNFANRAGWRKGLRLPNSALIGAGAASNRHTLNRMRAHLSELGYITYVPSGNIKECGVYTVTVLYNEEGFLNPKLFADECGDTKVPEYAPDENICEEKDAPTEEKAVNSGENVCRKQETTGKYKLENNKIQPKKAEKRKYFDDVYLTDDEYGKLTDEYGADTEGVLELLNNYKCSSGKSYKSDYFAVRSWAGDRFRERKRATPEFGEGDLYAPSPNQVLLNKVMIEKWCT